MKQGIRVSRGLASSSDEGVRTLVACNPHSWRSSPEPFCVTSAALRLAAATAMIERGSPMVNAHQLIRPVAPSILAPWILAAVVLLAPLASGYTWVSGGHAGEGHVHRHHLLERLLPNAHHHAAPLPALEESSSDDGYGAILRSASAFALSAVMMPAFLPELATYFDAAADALILAAVAALLLAPFSTAMSHSSRRPQTEVSPAERPPAG